MKYADVRWKHREWDDPYESSEEFFDAAGNRYCLEIQYTIERTMLAIAQTYSAGSNFPDYQILIELPTDLELACFLADKEH
ncbi:hypothetical protein [Methylobacterium fujisawaense]